MIIELWTASGGNLYTALAGRAEPQCDRKLDANHDNAADKHQRQRWRAATATISRGALLFTACQTSIAGDEQCQLYQRYAGIANAITNPTWVEKRKRQRRRR